MVLAMLKRIRLKHSPRASRPQHTASIACTTKTHWVQKTLRKSKVTGNCPQAVRILYVIQCCLCRLFLEMILQSMLADLNTRDFNGLKATLNAEKENKHEYQAIIKRYFVGVIAKSSEPAYFIGRVQGEAEPK